MTPKTLTYVLVGVFVVSLSSIIYFDLFNTYSFFGIIIPLIGFAAGYTYLHVAMSKLEKKKGEKKTFDYCWKKMNESLKNMPGGDRLLWDGGLGRQSDTRTFTDGKQTREFRTLYGNLARQRQHVLVIWDIEKEDIARYEANPGTDMLADPWFNFKPFYQEMNPEMLRGLLARRGKSSRLKVDMRKLGKKQPTDDYIDKALSGFQGGQQGGEDNE